MFHNLSSKSLVLLCYLLSQTLFSQDKITGTVYDAKDSTALESVSVYFDGTSIGTTTNKKGFFTIDKYDGGAPLIISFLGYESVIFEISKSASVDISPIFMKEKQEELAEVIVEPDPWSRKKKLEIFRREFLGKSPEAKKTRIKNEEVLRLHYSPSTEILTAEAAEPLIILNRHLGYEVRYDLDSFTVEFSTGSSGIQFTHMVLYQGFSYFKKLNRTRKKHLKNRKKTYLGSSLHFMRALSQHKLQENEFRIFHKRFEVPPYKYFKLKEKDDYVQVELLAEKISILFGELEQSGMQTATPFYIDQFGNHTPPTSVIFSGEMSTKRISHLLPLDYNPELND